MEVKVNFEAWSSLVCIFLFIVYTQNKNNRKKNKHFFLQNLLYTQN